MAGGAGRDQRDRLIARAHDLHRRGRFFEALGALEAAGAQPDGSTPEPLLRAALLARVGRTKEAIGFQREALTRADHPRARMALANMLRSHGCIAEAASEARAAIELAPDLGEAWWTLANLKTVALEEADRAAMLEALDQHTGSVFDRACLHFALAYALEQVGDYGEAWQHLASANGLRAGELGYRSQDVSALVDVTIAAFTPQFVAARHGCGDPSPAPIFIVGMPRAGSTLLERMLAGSGEIEPLGEVPVVVGLARALGTGGHLVDSSYLDGLAALTCEQLGALGASYRREAGRYRQGSKPRFSDKMPNNWLMTGLIALALPGAHIVDIRRHPLDCGVSNFRENFARGQAYSYKLAHIGAYYADYVRLMDYFTDLFPGRVHRVIYERLVEDPEREMRALCRKLGITYTEAMIRSHEHDGASRTASGAQVRQPINRRGIGTWKRYERHLSPLIDALGPVLTTWDA